jgi:hypothetical protein
MVSKVEKIKIEDESNGNVSPTIHDATDNTSTAAKEIDNSFEDDEQVQSFFGLFSIEPKDSSLWSFKILKIYWTLEIQVPGKIHIYVKIGWIKAASQSGSPFAYFVRPKLEFS